jgi:GTPase SAR1 family protein
VPLFKETHHLRLAARAWSDDSLQEFQMIHYRNFSAKLFIAAYRGENYRLAQLGKNQLFCITFPSGQEEEQKMGRTFIQVVMGPAGSGKSTYCHALQEHAATVRPQQRGRSSTTAPPTVHVANLDPAAEIFLYEPAFDVRDLITVQEVMEELGLGPNGALLYCMEYLLQNLDWLEAELDQFGDDEYLILDCPGQIELYTHVPVQRRLLDTLSGWGYEGRMVSVFCVDAAFLTDADKFLSGSLLSLSAMIALELPHVSVLTKCDLMKEEEVERILSYGSASHIWNLEQHRQSLLMLPGGRDDHGRTDEHQESEEQEQEGLQTKLKRLEKRRLQRHRLTEALSEVLDDWHMVSFVPLNIKSEESLEHVLATVNHCIQYGEDVEVRGGGDYTEIVNDEQQQQEEEVE